MIVLGIHGGVTLGQHEPSACLIVDGKVAALCEEERYLRIKFCYGYLPYYSIKACLKMANVAWEDVNLVTITGSTYDGHDVRIREYLTHSFGSCPRLERVHHQLAHMHAAFYASGLEDSIVLSLDATGDGASGMIGLGKKDGGIEVLETIPTENSLGYFYTMMTQYLGFNDGDEYKVMGLAPYGEASIDLSKIVQPHGTHWKFDWSTVRSNPPLKSPFEPMFTKKVESVVGMPPRSPSAPVTQAHKNLARSIQLAFEKCLFNLTDQLPDRIKGSKNLCYAGGISLNCSANKHMFYRGKFQNIYVPPVPSDRGLSLGCAYWGARLLGDKVWPIWNAYLGSSYTDDEIQKELTANGLAYEKVDDPCEAGAKILAENGILGWYQGRSEAGARALGNRSIVAKCESEAMRDKVNASIKYREEFRPFAPSVMLDKATDYFDSRGCAFPTMSFALDVVPGKKKDIAAVVHVDNTARLQTVRSSENELYYDLIKKYHAKTGCAVVLNTSFNLKGQPIIETPRDAIMTFFGCGMDALIMGHYLVKKPRPRS